VIVLFLNQTCPAPLNSGVASERPLHQLSVESADTHKSMKEKESGIAAIHAPAPTYADLTDRELASLKDMLKDLFRTQFGINVNTLSLTTKCA
jgi:hypothetical protein